MNKQEYETQTPPEQRTQRAPHWGSGRWAACCDEFRNADGGSLGRAGLPHCFSGCRFFALVPVVLGTVFLLLGYFLAPEATRALWMLGAGMALGMGLLCLLVMRRIVPGSGRWGCCTYQRRKPVNGRRVSR